MLRPLALLLLALAAGPAAAQQPPDVHAIVQRMKTALEPARASTRRIVLTLQSDGETAQYTAAQARKVVDGQQRMLTVVLAPSDARGVASLIMEGKNGKHEDQALWIPIIRRTRILAPVTAHEAFLQSDFTYADMGFVDLSATWSLRGTGTRDGVQTFELQEVPKSPWYYSKILTWVDQKTALPVERDYYDPAGALWKVETFEQVSVIDGVPSAMRITMKDVQTKNATVLDVSALRYDVDLPDSLFTPADLRRAIDAPVWPTVGK